MKYICLLLITLLLSCNSIHNTESFTNLCKRFKQESLSNRFLMADDLLEKLPKCPITSYRESSLSTLISYDYENPSFYLYEKDVEVLLGTPDKKLKNLIYTSYEYHMTSPKMNWMLQVEFRNGYVVNSMYYSNN